jgi:hypothetical protein
VYLPVSLHSSPPPGEHALNPKSSLPAGAWGPALHKKTTGPRPDNAQTKCRDQNEHLNARRASTRSTPPTTRSEWSIKFKSLLHLEIYDPVSPSTPMAASCACPGNLQLAVRRAQNTSSEALVGECFQFLSVAGRAMCPDLGAMHWYWGEAGELQKDGDAWRVIPLKSPPSRQGRGTSRHCEACHTSMTIVHPQAARSCFSPAASAWSPYARKVRLGTSGAYHTSYVRTLPPPSPPITDLSFLWRRRIPSHSPCLP